MCYRTEGTHKATEESQRFCLAYFNCDCTAMHITYWDSLLLYWVIFLSWNIKWTYGSVNAKESVWRQIKMYWARLVACESKLQLFKQIFILFYFHVYFLRVQSRFRISRCVYQTQFALEKDKLNPSCPLCPGFKFSSLDDFLLPFSLHMLWKTCMFH